jgi:phosphocarrier protein HPr
MKRKQVTVLWEEGLHARPAAKLVKLALSFQSTIFLNANERVADARSILGVLLLCASLGTVIDLEVSGEDEETALATIAWEFESGDFENPIRRDTEPEDSKKP